MARATRCTTFSKSLQVSPAHDTFHRIARYTSTQERTTSTERLSGKTRLMTTGHHPSTISRLSSKISTPILVTAPPCGEWDCGSRRLDESVAAAHRSYGLKLSSYHVDDDRPRTSDASIEGR